MIRKILKFCYINFIKIFFKKCYETRETQTPILIRHIFRQRILGINRSIYWPIHSSSIVTHPHNIFIGIDTSPGYMPGCYIQGNGKIYIGDYTQVASNVGIISANHDIYDSRKHNNSVVSIGKYCWIGMNSVILPNVVLGDFTIVGAGSVVTKSFKDGYCVIGGNPAKIIKRLDPSKCNHFDNKYKYNGFIRNNKFMDFKDRKLNFKEL